MSKKEIKAAKEGLDLEKSYVTRRAEEPPSHYLSRIKFIKNVLEGEPDISDELVEVLSFSYMNIKYLCCKYPARIMSLVKKYDPDQNATDVPDTIMQKAVPQDEVGEVKMINVED